MQKLKDTVFDMVKLGAFGFTAHYAVMLLIFGLFVERPFIRLLDGALGCGLGCALIALFVNLKGA